MELDHDAGDGARVPDARAGAFQRRSALLRRISRTPEAYVHVVEARSEGGGSTVVHVASTLTLAFAWCESRPAGDFAGDARYHVVPHLLDAAQEASDVDVAVYGVRVGENAVTDMIDDDGE